MWWDKVCLKSGEPWEVGFCQGLMNSSSFVCIVTKSGINDEDSGDQRNFWALKEESSCDNVLLEHRLAVELNTIQRESLINLGRVQQACAHVASTGGSNDSSNIRLLPRAQSSANSLPDIAVAE